jgi:endonuclease YncB( thermonuclease family)
MPKKSRKRTKKPSIPTRAFLLKYGLPAAIIPGIIIAAAYGFNWRQLINKDPHQDPKIYATHQQVSQVIDGDTIQLESGLPIRLISINAPDRGDPYFNKATAYLTDLIADKIIDVEYASNQNDPHGRLRGFAFVPCHKNQKFCREKGHLNLSEAMLGTGLARLSLSKSWSKDDYEQELKEAESYAKKHKLNLWSD